ncbi:hypothetical protein HD806DRAFT_548478 [Xylariaceae sp. AK1471]|nr:hypothetical protein HD806DRAFT_548478 [Xylariaceae sp. AK1471]
MFSRHIDEYYIHGTEAFPVHTAAEITHVSSVLPPPSSSQEDFRQLLDDYYQKLVGSGHREVSPWHDVADALTTAGVEGSVYDGAHLRYWPDEVKNQGERPSLEHQIYEVLELYLVSKQWASLHFESQLTLLNNGTMMAVTQEALSGGIVTYLESDPFTESDFLTRVIPAGFPYSSWL